MKVDPVRLKEFLVDSGLVSEADFEEARLAAEEKRQSLSKLLVDKNVLEPDEMRRAEAYVLGIPFVDLRDEQIDPTVLSLIPEPIARNHNIVAFRRSDNSLGVAMLDVGELSVLDFIKKKTGLKILPRLTNEESIKSALLQYQKSLKSEFGDIIQKEAGSIKTITEGEDDQAISEEDLKKSAEDLPVVRVVETLLKHAIIQNASDIHIEPAEGHLLIRYRIDGILHEAMSLPKETAPSIVARIKVLSNLKLDEKRLPQDGRFKTELNSEQVSFRVSVLPTQYGEKVVMRLLRDNISGFTLESLGFHDEQLEWMHEAIRSSTGMLLNTGPTGSGKTTTLYTLLDMLNTSAVNISTVEDPVEYQLPRINQTQVRPEIGLTFAGGLRTLLRQDPDIIMVGEIRDNETASLAVNAALTGHLVLSTLHTNSAAGALPRLLEMDVEPFLIVSTVNAVIAQRLIRKLPEAKEKYHMNREEIEQLGGVIDLDHTLQYLKDKKVIKEDDTWESVPFYRPKTDSPDGDYKGRIGIYEVLKVSETIKEMIIKGASDSAIEKQAKKEGMITMIEDGIYKAVQGQTSVEEVFRVTYD